MYFLILYFQTNYNSVCLFLDRVLVINEDEDENKESDMEVDDNDNEEADPTFECEEDAGEVSAQNETDSSTSELPKKKVGSRKLKHTSKRKPSYDADDDEESAKTSADDEQDTRRVVLVPKRTRQVRAATHPEPEIKKIKLEKEEEEGE